MGFISALFGGRQKKQFERGLTESQFFMPLGSPDLDLYNTVIDTIAVSEKLQFELKALLKQAFENPALFYTGLNEINLSDRGLAYPKNSHLTPKFVLIDKMILARQMAEVDWKEEEREIRPRIIEIIKAKGYNFPFSSESKYDDNTFDTITLLNNKELEPSGYSLELLDIDSDSYVFTIVPLIKKQVVNQLFNKLK